MMYKVDRGEVPAAVFDLFYYMQADCTRLTRQSVSNNYCIPKRRLEQGKRCITHRGPVIWQCVPEILKAAPSYKSFCLVIRELWKVDGDLGIT